MCIAIYKPVGKELSEAVLKTCFHNNNDGAGFAYISTDYHGVKRVKLKKFMKFDQFYTAYKRATDTAPDSPFIIHFRIGTHGEKTVYNCHPFYVDKNLVFIHNGIISGVGTDVKKSDTQLFNDKILKKLPKGWESNEAIQELIADYIGYSKLIFLNVSGEVYIVNEKKGNWNDGIWYSNESYKERKYTPHTTYNSGRYPVTTYRNKWWEVSFHTVETCNFCNSAKPLRSLTVYKDVDNPLDVIFVCNQCHKEVTDNGILSANEMIPLYKYIEEENKRLAIVHDKSIFTDEQTYMM